MRKFFVTTQFTKIEFDNFEDAIANWIRKSWKHIYCGDGQRLIGGIEIQEFDSEGNMFRAGWLIHVHESGHLYLNSSLTVA